MRWISLSCLCVGHELQYWWMYLKKSDKYGSRTTNRWGDENERESVISVQKLFKGHKKVICLIEKNHSLSDSSNRESVVRPITILSSLLSSVK